MCVCVCKPRTTVYIKYDDVYSHQYMFELNILSFIYIATYNKKAQHRSWHTRKCNML